MLSDIEQRLVDQGYRLITSRYNGICSQCGNRYQEGDGIYWKRDGEKTLVVCPNCYGGDRQASAGQIMCPYCGRTFHVTAHPQ